MRLQNSRLLPIVGTLTKTFLANSELAKILQNANLKCSADKVCCKFRLVIIQAEAAVMLC